MSDFITRQIRTWTPIAVGGAVSWLLTLGIELNAEAQAGAIIALTALLQGAYYSLVTIIAKKFPWAEALLGSTKKPEYKEV